MSTEAQQWHDTVMPLFSEFRNSLFPGPMEYTTNQLQRFRKSLRLRQQIKAIPVPAGLEWAAARLVMAMDTGLYTVDIYFTTSDQDRGQSFHMSHLLWGEVRGYLQALGVDVESVGHNYPDGYKRAKFLKSYDDEDTSGDDLP